MDMATRRTTAQIAEAMRRGTETRDAELMTSLYADDAEHVVVNRNAPPSRPHVLRGIAAIEAIWRENCAREMTHKVEAQLVDGDHIATRILCRYVDGTLVSSACLADVAGGFIRRQFELDCWDE